MLEREALWRMVVESMEKIRKGWREFSSHIKSEVGMAPRLDPGMTYGVGIKPSKKLFQICSILLALRICFSDISFGDF